MIEDIKRGWKKGRDWKAIRKSAKPSFTYAEDTLDTLKDELGDDYDRIGEAPYSSRWERVNENTPHFIKSMKYIEDYPEGRGRSKNLTGSIVEAIAETLPRKHKKTTSKPKRKIVKKPIKKQVKKPIKKQVKKCGCK